MSGIFNGFTGLLGMVFGVIFTWITMIFAVRLTVRLMGQQMSELLGERGVSVDQTGEFEEEDE